MKHLFAAVALVCLVGTAYADEKPSKEQMTKVEEALKAQGFTKWERIELDDGHFEVDDAIDASGKKFDLRIDATTMKVTSKVAD